MTTEAVTFGAAPTAPAAPVAPVAPTAPAAPGAVEVPAKFKNADGTPNLAALVASYGELERRFSAPQPNPALPPQPGTGLTDPNAPAAPQGLDMRAIAQDFQQNGGVLSDRAYAYAQARGVDRGTLDSIVAGQKALGEQRQQAVFTQAGGEQTYREMQAWASANFSAEEKMAYTRIMQQGGRADVAMAVDALKARFTAANGNGGRTLEGGVNGSNVTGFASTAEMKAAMSDPRYAKDPAYRQEVANKVANMQNTRVFTR